ncbi:MAG: 6-bladed beta-propeller [Balneolaceae bacterium]|nr:6-bladed beta-propeller [Balneolaceae bacterium]
MHPLMQHKSYMQKLLLSILLTLFFVQCSKNSKPEKAVSAEQATHIRILNEIPSRIQSIENLTLFPGDAEPTYSVELIPEQTFGETGEPYVIRVLDCVEDNKGKVILWNADANYEQILYVYNADGSYHTQLGRQGRGPGEYGHIVGMQAKAGKVFILDYTSQRLNEYSTKDYSFMHSMLFERWKSSEGLKFGYVEPRNDGNYLMTFSDKKSKLGRLEIKYQVMDSEGKRVNVKPLVFPAGFKINVGQSMRPTMPLTFMGKTITALSDEDTLYSVWTQDFLIRKYDAKGLYQSAIYYPIKGLPFDLDEYTKTSLFSPKAHDIKKAFDDMDKEFPTTNPVLDKLMVDDENRIWVALPADIEGNSYEWWILSSSGELLAKLVLPRDQPIFDIKNDYLYSKKMNEETGTEYVVKYRIEWTEKE